MPFATPREVGYLPSKLQARKKLELVLADRQKEILIGSILGDSYIYRQGKIQIEHGTDQKDYVFWKYDELQSLAYQSQPAYIERNDRRTGRKYGAYRFWLRQYFRPWRSFFYRKTGQKVFSEKIKLTPLSLAVWYMDDGCWSDNTCTISTDNFSQKSLQAIRRELSKRFSISTRIRSNGKLLIRAEAHSCFFSLIKAHVHDSLSYKIP